MSPTEFNLASVQFVALADYNHRFNTAVYDAAERLSAEDRRADRRAFFGSIQRTLGHILLADRIWLARMVDGGIAAASLEGATVIREYANLDEDLYPDWQELRAERIASDAAMKKFAAGLTSADLAKTMRYSNSRGVAREHAAWIAVVHMFNHQTHHRGQVTTLLSQAGVDVGVTDFLMFATS